MKLKNYSLLTFHLKIWVENWVSEWVIKKLLIYKLDNFWNLIDIGHYKLLLYEKELCAEFLGLEQCEGE